LVDEVTTGFSLLFSGAGASAFAGIGISIASLGGTSDPTLVHEGTGRLVW
jgi:hypothetical protein